MALFDIDAEAPSEKISSEVTLLPVKTAVTGKITGYRFGPSSPKYRDDQTKANYGTIWVQLILNVACSGDDVDFEELFGAREKTFPYTVRVKLNRSGLPQKEDNALFAAFTEEFGVDESDKELKEKGREIEREDYPEGEQGDISYKVAVVKAWWESFAERFKDLEVTGKTGIDKGFGDNPQKSNILTEIHPV